MTVGLHNSTPLRRLADCWDQLRVPLNAEERHNRPGNVPYWGANSIQGHVDSPLVSEEVVLIGEDGAPFFDRDRPVAFRVTEPIWPNNHIHVLKPRALVDARWLAYALNDVDYSLYVIGSTRDKLTQSALMRIQLPTPAVYEQRAIADFLDRETARIDTLIEEQQRLIELLRERRRSVINAALTPTGGGWRCGRIKFLGQTSLGKMLDAGRALRDGDERQPYVRAADVLADGTINLRNLNQMPFSSVEMKQFDLRAEDILLIEGGATVGRPGFLQRDAPGIAFQKTVNRLRLGPTMSARFCYWELLRRYESDYYSNHFGSVSFVHLTGEKLREIAITYPPLIEQRQIAARLDRQTARIDALIAETEQFIELSRERRSALITAAVTGQTDVRNKTA